MNNSNNWNCFLKEENENKERIDIYSQQQTIKIQQNELEKQFREINTNNEITMNDLFHFDENCYEVVCVVEEENKNEEPIELRMSSNNNNISCNEFFNEFEKDFKEINTKNEITMNDWFHNYENKKEEPIELRISSNNNNISCNEFFNDFQKEENVETNFICEKQSMETIPSDENSKECKVETKKWKVYENTMGFNSIVHSISQEFKTFDLKPLFINLEEISHIIFSSNDFKTNFLFEIFENSEYKFIETIPFDYVYSIIQRKFPKEIWQIETLNFNELLCFDFLMEKNVLNVDEFKDSLTINLNEENRRESLSFEKLLKLIQVHINQDFNLNNKYGKIEKQNLSAFHYQTKIFNGLNNNSFNNKKQVKEIKKKCEETQTTYKKDKLNSFQHRNYLSLILVTILWNCGWQFQFKKRKRDSKNPKIIINSMKKPNGDIINYEDIYNITQECTNSNLQEHSINLMINIMITELLRLGFKFEYAETTNKTSKLNPILNILGVKSIISPINEKLSKADIWKIGEIIFENLHLFDCV